MYNYRQKLLAKYTKKFNVVLDIGFAEIPNKYLKNKIVIGLDLKHVPKPINYTNVIFGDANSLTNLFDESSIESICAGELFEHIYNPIEFLRNCHFVLKPNGRMVISTPNPYHLFEVISTIFLSKKIFYDPEHVCIYPQRWLIRMFEIAGFKNVIVKSGGINIPLIGDVRFPRLIAEFSFVIAEAGK
jgi:SAM-dependent methyltransferase